MYPELYVLERYKDGLNYSSLTQTGAVDVVSGLYSNNNMPPLLNNYSGIVYPQFDKWNGSNLNDQEILAIIPSGLKRSCMIDINNPASIKIDYSSFSLRYVTRIIGEAIKIPGFPLYSSYSLAANKAQVIMSMKRMKEIAEYSAKLDPYIQKRLEESEISKITTDGIPKKALYIKFYESTPRSIKDTLLKELNNIVDNDTTKVFLIDDILDAAESAASKLQIFFIVIGLVSLILTFFLVWTSFYCNIKDNITEYGIMR